MKKLMAMMMLGMGLTLAAAMPAFAEDAAVGQKLDQVLQNQKQIMDKLNAIQAELDVVKVRATLR